MQRIAPKPPFEINGPVIDNSIGPVHLGNEITETEPPAAGNAVYSVDVVVEAG